ncbi:MAG: DUF2071 domain-containing protein [Myxococcota bacterium]
MHVALERQDHRPWPLPTKRWTWRQSWRDLLFAHWPVSASALAPLVPAPLEVQSFEGTSWVGVVPFRMAGVMKRPLPDLPWISAFPELNLRLYVEYEGRPGVFFLSLDATNPLAVWAARRFFHLPYEHAAIDITSSGETFDYRCQRRGVDAVFEGTFCPTSDVRESRAGTLEHWLTERYCLYAHSPRGDLFRAEVHHVPWPLQDAAASIERNTVGRPHGLDLAGPPATLHFSRRIDVVVWSPERIMTS